MKSAVAELIGEFFAKGGKVTPCPEGNGLVPFEYKPKTSVGRVKRAQRRRIYYCERILELLGRSASSLTLLGIEKETGLDFDKLRGAVAALADEGKIIVTQRAERQPRYFSLAPEYQAAHAVVSGTGQDLSRQLSQPVPSVAAAAEAALKKNHLCAQILHQIRSAGRPVTADWIGFRVELKGKELDAVLHDMCGRRQIEISHFAPTIGWKYYRLVVAVARPGKAA